MRIVSLLPSATEIVCALGLEEALVGITHECDYPATIVGKSVITSSILQADPDPLSALEIDEKVREALAAGESLYRIDVELLKSLKPDVVLTQGLCDVCAVNHKAVVAAVAALGSSATVVDLAPTTLVGVLEMFRQVGRATGRESEAEELARITEARWATVRNRLADVTERPRTLLLEWPDPPFSAGHWNPELLELAGGIGGAWDKAGEPSRTLNWDDIVAFQPETIVLMACGFDTYRALDEAFVLPDGPGEDRWFSLPAVQNGDCYAVDGSSYFNRPGPRLAESAEILATILHPDAVTDMMPPYSAQRFAEELTDRKKWAKWLEDVAAYEAEQEGGGES